jgi:CRISPR-associated protein Cst2
MTKKYLHFAVVFKGSNLNYGEGIGNILSLKKMSSYGKNYSYVSRQALRYDIVRLLNEIYDYPLTPVDKAGGVIQFEESTTIQDYPEIDFFGYMKTSAGNKIRKAVIRITDAVSLEPFHNEMDFGTNKGLADRIENNVGNDIFQPEIHNSYYSYAITCDLDKIGKDEIYDIELNPAGKSQRLSNLLNVIKLLYRDIRGKRENLSPLFVIGGLYDSGNPFFYNRIKLSFTKEKTLIDTEMINSVLKIKVLNDTVGDQTILGHVAGEFSNVDSIKINETNKSDIEDFFVTLSEKIKTYYG